MPGHKMDSQVLKTTVEDYSAYIEVDANKELQRAHAAIDEMLTRLDEFEGVTKVIQEESGRLSSNALNKILHCRGEVDVLMRRIHSLELLAAKISADLSTLESQVETSEIQIGAPENKLKSLFKPFLDKLSKETGPNSGERRSDNFSYERPEIFKPDDYFNPR